MSTSFSDQFSHFLAPSASEIKDAMTAGIVILDSNVLLSSYRFAPSAREELFSVLDNLRERVWVPHQVGLEFHKNRVSAILDLGADYRTILESIAKHRTALNDEIGDKIRHLASRSSLSKEETVRLLRLAESAAEPLETALTELRDQHGLTKSFADDPILERIQAILSGKVGSPFTPEEEEAALAEATDRIERQLPPGFRDADKKESPHGDYFVWKQAVSEVARRGARIFAFVTNDVKDDWYLKLKNQTIAARPELAREARLIASARLVMMPIRSFLYHAKTYLDVAVSAETIRQASQLFDEASRIRVAQLKRNANELAMRQLQAREEQMEVMRALAVAHSAFDSAVAEELAARQTMDEALVRGKDPGAFDEAIIATTRHSAAVHALRAAEAERIERERAHTAATRRLEELTWALHQAVRDVDNTRQSTE